MRKLQPARLAPNACAYSFSTSGVSRSGSTVMETNAIFAPKSRPELILHERHHRRQHRAGRRAHGKNEGHGDHLAAEVRERDRRAVLRGQREFRRRRDLRQRRLQGGVLRGVTRKHQQQRRQQSQRRKRQDERRPHAQPFSSRLSSLRNRQSVASAMILLGFDLIMPASRSRSA